MIPNSYKIQIEFFIGGRTLKNSIYQFLILSFFIHTYLLSLQTSVIVPCHQKHVCHLPELLEQLSLQTVCPDEVVISASGLVVENELMLNSLEAHAWPFQLKILRSQAYNNAAKNRNNCLKSVSHDLIICQDADDLPHPQRIEIIKYFFEKYGIFHLLHSFIDIKLASDYLLKYDLDKIPTIKVQNHQELYVRNIKVANGPCAFRRSVLRKVKGWNTAFNLSEDNRFNSEVYKNFKNKCMVLPIPIYFVNWHASTYRD